MRKYRILKMAAAALATQRPAERGCHHHSARPAVRVCACGGHGLQRPLLLERLEGRVVPGFLAPLGFDAGLLPYSVAVGDFDRDGKPDLAVANSGSNDVSVLLGKGDGTFQTARNVPAGSFPRSLAVGDFNGDGNLDLAVANSGSNDVSVLLGNGDGTFQTARNFPAGRRPYSVAVADFDRDRTPDLSPANPQT